MKLLVKFFLFSFLIILFGIRIVERTFHHSFEKFILSTFQRINYNPNRFPNRITIIDSSPIYNLSLQRTDRVALADLLYAVKLGQPEIVGLDILLESDSLYRDEFGDSLLKDVLWGWDEIVVPHQVDPYFEVFEPQRLANIQIHDGYEIPVSNNGYLSLAFQMAVQLGLQIPATEDPLVVNYGMAYENIRDTNQLIPAMELLDILNNHSLSETEKQDELAMRLASQIVLVGFCNDALNVDRHETPLVTQPGILIWANTLQNLLFPADRIHYNPWWGLLLGATIITLVLMGMKAIYERYNFFYLLIFFLLIMGILVSG